MKIGFINLLLLRIQIVTRKSKCVSCAFMNLHHQQSVSMTVEEMRGIYWRFIENKLYADL